MAQAKAEGHVLEDGEMGKEQGFLVQVDDVPFFRGHGGDVASLPPNRAFVRGQQARDDPQERGLSAARAADHRKHLPLVKTEAHRIEDAFTIEPLGQTGDFEERASLGGHASLRTMRWLTQASRMGGSTSRQPATAA